MYKLKTDNLEKCVQMYGRRFFDLPEKELAALKGRIAEQQASINAFITSSYNSMERISSLEQQLRDAEERGAERGYNMAICKPRTIEVPVWYTGDTPGMRYETYAEARITDKMRKSSQEQE